MSDWGQSFFDADYIRLWAQRDAPGPLNAQVEGLWSLLGLEPRSGLLDAPCG